MLPACRCHHDGDAPSGLRQQQREPERQVVADVIDDQHAVAAQLGLGNRRRRIEHVRVSEARDRLTLRRRNRVARRVEPRARREVHGLRPGRGHIVGVRLSAEAHVDTEPLERPGEVVRELEPCRAARQPAGEQQLATELVRALQERHAVSAPRGGLGEHHARGPPTDDEHVARRLRRPAFAAERPLPAGRRVDRAGDPLVVEQAPQASLVRAHAATDLFPPAFAGLCDEIRVGDVGAHHRDKIGLPARHDLGGAVDCPDAPRRL